jgi:hypothetical protein
VNPLRSIIRQYREVNALARDATESPMIRTDIVAGMLEHTAQMYERGGELERALALRQFSADLQEWAHEAPSGTPFPFTPRQPLFLP